MDVLSAMMRMREGERVFMDETLGIFSTDADALQSPVELRIPSIGIYTGKGASHSWLWAVDTFEKHGLDLIFPFSEKEVNFIPHFEFLFVAGGDTFALADGLGKDGAEKIKKFVKEGGIYLGSCAGAYLVLYTSKSPLNLFNFVPVQIANFERELPPVRAMREKAFNRYACCFIIHPVRDEVLIETSPFPPFFSKEKISAPIFGGPVFKEPEGRGRVLARFSSFTERTVFLFDREIAERVLPGKPAIIEWRMGDGAFYLFGPHLEHPSFKFANSLLLKIIAYNIGKMRKKNSLSDIFFKGVPLKLPDSIRRLVSDMFMKAISIGDMKAFWKIGEKYYMPEHIPVFVRAIHKRMFKKRIFIEKEEMEIIEENLKVSKEILSEISPSTPEEKVEALISSLKDALRIFLRAYFRRGEYGALKLSQVS